MLTLNKQKNGSDADYTPTTPQTPTETVTATPKTGDYGEASAFWPWDASATGDGELCGNDGAENAGKENDGCTKRNSNECDGANSVEHGQADKK